MRYDMTSEERDFFIQMVASEDFARARGSSEDYLNAVREKFDFVVVLKNRYKIDKDAGLNVILDSGVIITNE